MNQKYDIQGNGSKSIADFERAFEALDLQFQLNKTTGRVEFRNGGILDKYAINSIIVRLQEQDRTFYNTKQITRMILFFGSQHPYYGAEVVQR